MMHESLNNSPVMVEIVALLRPLIFAISAREIGCLSDRILSRMRRLTSLSISWLAAFTSLKFGLRELPAREEFAVVMVQLYLGCPFGNIHLPDQEFFPAYAETRKRQGVSGKTASYARHALASSSSD
jgi:hypothetical protein